MKYFIVSLCALLIGAEKIDWSFTKPKNTKPLASTILNAKEIKKEPKKVAPQNNAPQLGEPVIYFYQSLPVVTYPQQGYKTIYGTRSLGPNCFR